jgi:nucleoside-diphosphate-sugar epimerase
LAQALRPALSSFAGILTAGRAGCDVSMDLAWPWEQFRLPCGLDAVIHLASHFGGKDFAGILGAEHVNVLGALKLCRSCVEANVGHVVLVSSIFAGLGPESPFYGAYALSKRHAEEVAQLYSESVKLPLTVLRPTQFYGVGESFRKHQPFLYTIIDRAEAGQDIIFFGANDAMRNLIHVEDLAEIIARVVRRRVLGHYACPSLVNVRYSEIATAAIAAFGSASVVRFAADKPDIPDNAFPPTDRLYREIDYSPRVSLALGMEKEASYRRGRK